MKKNLGWLALMVVLSLFVSCSQRGGSAEATGIDPDGVAKRIRAKSRSELNFTYVAPQTGNEYWDGVLRGIQEGEAKMGVNVNVVAPGAIYDITVVVDLLEAAIAADVDGIIMGAYDANAVIPGFQKAKDKGIPVVCVDADSPDSARSFYAGTSNPAAGAMAAKVLAEKLGGKGNVVVLSGQLTGDSGLGRINGFKEGLVNFPDVKLLTVENTETDALIAVQKAEAVFNTYPEVTGAFGVQVHDGVGLAKVAFERKKNIVIVGFDDTAEMLEYIRQGVAYATMVQDTRKMGNLGVELLVQIIEGNAPAERRIDTGIIVVTKENIDTLYPKN